MKRIVLKLDNLHYNYNNSTKIIRGIDLEIERNNLVVLVGKVGGGKSTILKLMAGLYEPAKGDVIINSISVTKSKNKLFHQDVGILFENPDDQIFYPIVADDISFGPRNLKLPKNEVNKRVIKAAEQVGVLHLLERHTDSLSYGEKTLVALAGILAMKPKIILMDSPELGFDLWSKPDFIDLIEKLKMNHTIVIATNDLEILRIADKIHLLWKGAIRGSYSSYRTFKSAMSRRKDS